METIKNAIGLGSTTTEQGREPVSGVAGSGVAGEPYDQGNADSTTLGGKAAQHTDPTTDHSTNPNVSSTTSTGPYTIGSGLGSNNSTSTGGVTSSQGVTPNVASATTSTGPAVDPTSTNTTGVPPHNSDLANKADPRVASSSTSEVRSSQGVIPNAASATSTTGPATDPTSTNTTAGPHSSDLANKADPRVDSDRSTSLSGKSTASPAATTSTAPQTTTEQPGKTGSIGSKSWFSTALPFVGKGNKAPESSDVNTTSTSSAAGAVPNTTTTTQSKDPSTLTKTSTLEDVKSQPPNNLPSTVPTGTSTDFAALGSAAPGATSSTATGRDTDPMHAHQDIPTSTVGGNDRASTSGGAPSHSLAASRASVAPLEKPDHDNAPLKPAERGGHHGSNPGAIPVAGGKKIGEDAYTERKSVQLDSAPSTGGAGLGGETSANTARNADPTSTSTTTGTTATGTSTVGTSGAGEKESVSSGHSEGKEKKSLKEKIKEKVHIH